MAQLEARPYRGYAGIRKYFNDVDATWGEWRVEVEQVLSAPDGRVVIVMSTHMRGKSSGLPFTQRLANLWEFRDNKLWRATLYRVPPKRCERSTKAKAPWVAGATGLEPAGSGVTGRRANRSRRHALSDTNLLRITSRLLRLRLQRVSHVRCHADACLAKASGSHGRGHARRSNLGCRRESSAPACARRWGPPGAVVSGDGRLPCRGQQARGAPLRCAAAG